MEREWAPAIKRELGDVWHLLRLGGEHAFCNLKLRLDRAAKRSATTAAGPNDVYVCKRCKAHARRIYAAA